MAADVDASKLSKLENDKPVNLTLKTIERLAAALRVAPLELFVQPRPEEMPDHVGGIGGVGSEAGSSINPLAAEFYTKFLEAVDRDDPAPDTLEGDVLKAHAALTRAVRRIAGARAHPRASGEPDR
jgi:transcriptional regulator with XRE-family HTH domain